jgi:hypothetical protein
VKLALLSGLTLNNKVANDIIRDIDFSYTDFIPEALQVKYSRYLNTQLNERLKRIKWHNSGKETIAESSMKASLLSLAGGRLGNSNLKANILRAMGYFSSPKIVNRYYDFLLS